MRSLPSEDETGGATDLSFPGSHGRGYPHAPDGGLSGMDAASSSRRLSVEDYDTESATPRKMPALVHDENQPDSSCSDSSDSPDARDTTLRASPSVPS